MIHVYTGNGKGKTTAALGLGLRAVGAGKKVLMIQFLKDGKSSEINAIKKYLPGFEIKSFGRSGFPTKNTLARKDFDLVKQGFNFAQKAILSKEYDLVILDEINVALNFGLIGPRGFLKFLKIIPQHQKQPQHLKQLELILTGRNASKEIIEIADLVTEMKEKKHYYKEGITAKRGMEY